MPAARARVARGTAARVRVDGRRWASLAGAAGGGVLYFLGYVGWGVWPCLFVFLVPLWWALERTRGWLASFATGLVFGLVAYAGGFLWLWHLVDPFLDGRRAIGVLFWLAYGGWFALAYAVYALLFHAIRRRGWTVAVAGIAPFVMVEWLQPQIFPLYAGNGLIAVPLLVQTADLGGPLLLTALLGVANLAIYETLWSSGRPLATRVTALVLALVVVVYGWFRMDAIDAAAADAPRLRVGVVQANLGLLDKETQSLLSHRRHVEQTHELLAAGAVDLVVWPETAYVRGIRRPLPLSGRPILEDLSPPLLFGASSVRDENGRLEKTNAAFLIGPDAMIHDVYDKNLLIPFAEYLPLGRLVPALRGWFPHVEEFAAATDVPALRLGAWRLVTPICYEAVRPEFVRRMVQETDAHLVVTLANDAWFGDSHEPWLHLALARLRAVEHRRFVVRATNSGISAIVDPAGRIVARTGLLARENLRGEVGMLDRETVYGRLGDWPGWLSAAVVLVGLAFRLTPRAPRG